MRMTESLYFLQCDQVNCRLFANQASFGVGGVQVCAGSCVLCDVVVVVR